MRTSRNQRKLTPRWLAVSILQECVDRQVVLRKNKDLRAKKALRDAKCSVTFSAPFAEVLNYNPSPAVAPLLTTRIFQVCATRKVGAVG